MRLPLLFLILSAALARAAVIELHPAVDETAVLRNPGMGWVLYENYPVDRDRNGSSTLVTFPDELFPDVDEVAVMFSWADVERRPGEYDFADVDHAYDHWRKRGKAIQLRLSAESLLWWNTRTPPRGRGIPSHVLERMPKERRQQRTMEKIPYDVVDARDPVYLDALGRFLRAVAAHYSKDRPVTLVDLRGFGVWGEWHSGYRYASPEDRREGLKAVIDCWSAAFPNHTLSLSYSYDPDGPRELYAGSTRRFEEAAAATYPQFLRHSAFDHAMTKANVTWRRDGAGGAVHSNERKLAAEEFTRLTKGPFMCEFLGGYAANRKGGQRWLEWMLDDALGLHPNYVALLGWQGGDALAFCREQPEMIRRGLRTMGYRLVPVSVKYDDEVADGRVAVEMTWENRGVGRAVREFDAELVLMRDGKIVSTAPLESLGVTKWIKGKGYPVRCEARFTGVPAGRYELCLRLRDGPRPIALPLKEQRAEGAYAIGPATLR